MRPAYCMVVFLPSKSELDSIGQIAEGLSPDPQYLFINRFYIESKKLSDREYISVLHHEALHAFQYGLKEVYLNTGRVTLNFYMRACLNIFLFSEWTAGKIGLPLSNITGAIRRMSGGNLDVRMDFKAENEFLQIRDAFNDMVSKLEASQAEKSRLEEARKRMFVDISHDLKTPITVIGGYSKALAEYMVSDEQQRQRYIETIYNRSMRVSELIDDLFEFSRLESGKPELKLEMTDMTEFIKGIAAEYYEQFEEKNLLLELDIPDRQICRQIDRKQITRAISNLLINAIRYNPAGTTIRIALVVTDSGLTVEISDNGAGIPENLKNTIFEPFVRGDSSRRSDGGTGLGLAIAKSITASHGGSLRLLSDTGTYKTSFVLELPLR